MVYPQRHCCSIRQSAEHLTGGIARTVIDNYQFGTWQTLAADSTLGWILTLLFFWRRKGKPGAQDRPDGDNGETGIGWWITSTCPSAIRRRIGPT